jgi:hypothetical protein
LEQFDENSQGISFTTEREAFYKHRIQKRKRTMKGITSDDLNEKQQRKTQKIEQSRRAYPPSRNGQSNLGNLGHEVNKVLSTENRKGCTDEKLERNVQTCTATNVSKWSKYT